MRDGPPTAFFRASHGSIDHLYTLEHSLSECVFGPDESTSWVLTHVGWHSYGARVRPPPFRPLWVLICLSVALLTSCGPRHTTGDDTSPAPAAPISSRAPLFGGGLFALSGGRFVAVADADRSAVFVVDLELKSVRGRIDLPSGSWPNRMTEDAKGNLRVALRGLGSVATLSITTMSVKSVDYVCPEPRGLAFSAHLNATLIACASGELVTLPMTGSIASRWVERDLRDVVVINEHVFVTTFREGWILDVSGAQSARIGKVPGDTNLTGEVAWRAIAHDDQVVVAHQLAQDTEIIANLDAGTAPSTTGVYGAGAPSPGGCQTSPVVRSAVSTFALTGRLVSTQPIGGALPVDVAFNPATQHLAVALAGSGGVEESFTCPKPPTDDPTTGIADVGPGVVVLTTNPPAVHYQGTTIALDSSVAPDEGRAFFHRVAPAGLACASCHPEGGDDGHVWTFAGRSHRTQSLTGGLLETAPFHWEGRFADLGAVMDETFVVRMGAAARPSAPTLAHLGSWLEQLPSPRGTPVSADVVSAGQKAFALAGCDSCHSGPHLTNDQTMDVGTGGAFQVPSLNGVSARLPVMHGGCAKVLRDRFDPECGGRAHGDLSRLTQADLDALEGYLNSL